MADLNTVFIAFDVINSMKAAVATIPTKEIEVVPGQTGSITLEWTGIEGQKEVTIIDPATEDYNTEIAALVVRCQRAATKHVMVLEPGFISTNEEADLFLNRNEVDWVIGGSIAKWDLTLLEYFVIQVLVASSSNVSALDEDITNLPWWP